MTIYWLAAVKGLIFYFVSLCLQVEPLIGVEQIHSYRFNEQTFLQFMAQRVHNLKRKIRLTCSKLEQVSWFEWYSSD